MRRKSLIVLSLALVLVFAQSCKSHPETNLLTKYFNAISMKDTTTMSTMAVDPITIDAASWKIVSVSEEKIEPAALAEIGAKEADLKKQQDANVPAVLDAKDTLDIAKDDFTTARTAAAKAAAKAKMDAAQTKYDEAYTKHQDIIRQFNEAKAAAAKEEEITSFSLGAGQLPEHPRPEGQRPYEGRPDRGQDQGRGRRELQDLDEDVPAQRRGGQRASPRPVGHHEDREDLRPERI